MGEVALGLSPSSELETSGSRTKSCPEGCGCGCGRKDQLMGEGKLS